VTTKLNRKVAEYKVEFSKQEILSFLRCIDDDSDIADIIIETLDENQEVLEIVKKWISQE